MDVVIGWIRLKPRKRDEFMALVPEYATATRAMAGCTICELTESREDPDVVVAIFGYTTPEAHAAQVISPHERKLLAALNDLGVDGRFDNFVSDGVKTDRLTFPLAER